MKILVCTDESEQARDALRFTKTIVAASDARITLLGITEKKENQEKILEALKQGQRSLQAKQLDVEIVPKAGQPIQEIIKCTKETEYDLVVIGVSKKSRRGPYLLSAKAYRIIKSITPPVLVVIGGGDKVNRVLVCSGGENNLTKGLELVKEIGRLNKARITLLHVLAEPPAIYSGMIKLQKDADRLLSSHSLLGMKLRKEKEVLDERGLITEVKLRLGSVSGEVIREINDGHYDLVVAGSSQVHGIFGRYILGNVTRHIVNHAERPVLIVRTGGTVSRVSDYFKELLSELIRRKKAA